MEEQRGEEERMVADPNPDPCPICLGFMTRLSYLDHCFHKFCYDCILRWTKVVSSKSSSSQPPSSVKCPLCKTDNFSIIYGYDGYTFEQHFINQNTVNSTFFSKAHKYRLQCYYTEPGLLRETFKVTHYWKTHKYLLPNKHLEIWTRRELQALLQEENVEIIMHHILGVIESFSRRSSNSKATTTAPQPKQEEFRVLVSDAARPFLTARSERFVDEVELFLASGLTIEAYDNAYKRRLGWKKPDETPQDAEPSVIEHNPVAPCLLLFDDDPDELEWEQDEQEHIV